MRPPLHPLADETSTDGHGGGGTRDVVSDRFVLKEIVGAGAMGTVYRAHDRFEGADVAVKLLHDLTSTAATRFDREAAVLASLAHPSVVKYLAHGATRSGTRFI